MAKSQKRSNREVKKPKADKKPAATEASRFKPAAKPTAPKGGQRPD